MKCRCWLPLAALSLALAVACDPDLTVPKLAAADSGTDARTESSTMDGSLPTQDAGETEAGSNDAGAKHAIDGVNDFAPGEKFSTTSSGTGYDAYFAWDDQRLYFGMSGADVASSSATKWVMVYLEGTPGHAVGESYGGVQQPNLPFSAGTHLRWKADQSFSKAEKWNGAAWVDASATVPIVAMAQGSFMEMSITRSAIGSPSTLKVHMNMLIEGGGSDWTYAGMPSTSFVDSLNPSFTRYFDFDLSNTTKAPNSYTPGP